MLHPKAHSPVANELPKVLLVSAATAAAMASHAGSLL